MPTGHSHKPGYRAADPELLILRPAQHNSHRDQHTLGRVQQWPAEAECTCGIKCGTPSPPPFTPPTWIRQLPLPCLVVAELGLASTHVYVAVCLQVQVSEAFNVRAKWNLEAHFPDLEG